MIIFLFTILVLSSGCQTAPPLSKKPTDKELFKYANYLKKQSSYLEALEHFKQLRGRFLYSPLAKEADLAIADIYFQQKDWIQAVQAYKFFYERHPKHPQNDRVSFYLALSYFHQLPSTPDRDLSLSTETIKYFDQHLKHFPASTYKKEATDHKNKVLLLLAQKEWMIAKFHIRQNREKSALPYVKKLLKKYSNLLSSNSSKKSKLPSITEIKVFIKKWESNNKGS